MIRLKKDGVGWRLDPEFAPMLDRVLHDAGRIVKHSPAKQVTFHEVDGRNYYVKRYRNDVAPLRGLKFLFKASNSRREWDRAVEIQKRGVPVVRHLAFGESWGPSGLRESILITEAFDGQSLLEFPRRESADVQRALGAFVRQMHDRGITQFDLAPNILVREHPLELRRVDVHHAVIKESLSETERLENLAFTHVLLPLSDDFFSAYGWAGERAGRTLRRSAEVRREFLERRARRCLKRNAEFAPRRLGELMWRVRLPLLTPPVEAVLRDPDGFLARRAEILKPGRSSTVGRGDGLVLKRHNFRKLGNLFKDLFRPSKGRRGFHKAYHLELAGVPSARPVATADERAGGIFVPRSFFLMEEILGAQHLGQWQGDAKQAACSLAWLLAKLHNEGFSHRDLKETNLVFDKAGKLYVIDLEGLEFMSNVPRERVVADLARLARGAEGLPRFTPALRWIFMRRYARARGAKLKELLRG